MSEIENNIETAARALCERELRAMSKSTDASPAVDRYWPCVAAEIEAGLIDTAGNRLVPYSLEKSRDAYRAWRERHPNH